MKGSDEEAGRGGGGGGGQSSPKSAADEETALITRLIISDDDVMKGPGCGFSRGRRPPPPVVNIPQQLRKSAPIKTPLSLEIEAAEVLVHNLQEAADGLTLVGLGFRVLHRGRGKVRQVYVWGGGGRPDSEDAAGGCMSQTSQW